MLVERVWFICEDKVCSLTTERIKGCPGKRRDKSPTSPVLSQLPVVAEIYIMSASKLGLKLFYLIIAWGKLKTVNYSVPRVDLSYGKGQACNFLFRKMLR